MIIFGTRGVKSTMSEGDFQCPQCEVQTPYKFKKVTNFFTLYFIPLIPLGKVGEYVECTACKSTFIPRVLDYNKSASADSFLSQYEKAMKHSMVLIMLADGVIDEEEMLMVQKIINKLSHNDITLDELEAYVEETKRSQEDISTYLKGVAPSLNEHGKEMVIKCAISVAAADGHIDATEIEEIKKMATAMDMSGSHLKGILAEIEETSSPSFSDN